MDAMEQATGLPLTKSGVQWIIGTGIGNETAQHARCRVEKRGRRWTLLPPLAIGLFSLLLSTTASLAQNVYSNGGPWIEVFPKNKDAKVFYKLCSPVDQCSTSKIIAPNESSYALLLFESRGNFACGDLYVKANLVDANGIAIDWTNDRGFLGAGGKTIMGLSRVYKKFNTIGDLMGSCSNFK